MTKFLLHSSDLVWEAHNRLRLVGGHFVSFPFVHSSCPHPPPAPPSAGLVFATKAWETVKGLWMLREKHKTKGRGIWWRVQGTPGDGGGGAGDKQGSVG